MSQIGNVNFGFNNTLLEILFAIIIIGLPFLSITVFETRSPEILYFSVVACILFLLSIHSSNYYNYNNLIYLLLILFLLSIILCMTTLCISKIPLSHNIPKNILIPLTIGITSFTVSLISAILFYFTEITESELYYNDIFTNILVSAFEPGIVLGLLGFIVALIIEFNILLTDDKNIPQNGKIILLVCIILLIAVPFIMFFIHHTGLLR
uniref:Uncharacterized protein n=1 Tax=viral metagenome TaxID=1070528 RepID=A0A6C0DGJ3_9ZZZZ